MEKLTINDILGLRMIRNGVPRSPLPPLKESEETDMSAMTDSGIFTQPEESKAEQTNKDISSDPNPAESSSVIGEDSSSSSDVMWESLEADIYPENMMLTSAGDTTQPVFPAGSHTCLRQMSKNVSVDNLHALNYESFCYKRKGPTLQTLDEGEFQQEEHHSVGHMPKQDKNLDSLSSFPTDSYKMSLSNIFQYIFGGKSSIPSQSASDNIPTSYSEGNSVPETYDHFFSEFDTESFFYPLITKDELVPIFSYSHSATRDLQFPEAYEHFFASSSSDDSSGESDGEDSCSPVRVVSRFSRTTSASHISTDIYEHFFTDGDLRQNFFWNTTLSFRNMSLTKCTVHKETLSNPLSSVPVSQSGRSIGRIVHPINALGNQDIMLADPLIHHLDNRIYTQLRHQPFSFEDLQTAVSNPILLANVSALTSIRYLRKYVKMEAATSEKKLKYTAV
ncbi:hypothetical protein KUCAC02_012147 [Chaenocephalus aceratus]|uniref:Uncharacterized protein n=1 Tax=Chaenocephalus aceratus TaxID=36190 RepID=A0ACB9X9M7_CHAAC|nr:hypothetical protein KUCAC02_012147 [Chaenocephalus aceratus]